MEQNMKKIMMFITPALLGLMVVLTGCTQVTVTSGIEPGADFSGYKNYAWFAAKQGVEEGVRVDNPKVAKSIRSAVNKILKRKGYLLATDGQADFVITWLGAIDKEVKQENLNHFYSTYGYGAAISGTPQNQEIEGRKISYEKGTILLEAYDAKSRKSVWQGKGSARLLKQMTDQDVDLYIESVVGKILQDFPKSEKSDDGR
jgi:hypothetical protein